MAWNSLPDFIRHPTSSTDVRREPSTLGVYLKRILVRTMLVHPDSTLGALNDYALYKSTHSLSHLAFDTRLHTRPPQTNDVNRLAEIYSVNRFSHIGVKNCSSVGSCFLMIFLKKCNFLQKSLISYGGSNEGPHRAAPYEEFFLLGQSPPLPFGSWRLWPPPKKRLTCRVADTERHLSDKEIK